MSLGLQLQENGKDDSIVDRKSLSDFRSARLTLGTPIAELEPISDDDEDEQDESNAVKEPRKQESDGEVFYGEEEDEEDKQEQKPKKKKAPVVSHQIDTSTPAAEQPVAEKQTAGPEDELKRRRREAYEHREQLKRIQRKKKKNTVNFKYALKVAKMPKKQNWGSWLTNIFASKKGSSVRDLAYVEHVPEQENVPKNTYVTSV